MAKKKPTLPDTTWFIREVLEPGTPVGAVTCALGRIIAAGPSLYRIVPGTWDVQYRGFPKEAGWPVTVAMEPRPPYRVAVGSDVGDVIIFTDTSNATSITGHPFTDQRGAKQAAELAWVVHDGESTLFARADDGMLYRMQAEGWDALDMPPVHAIARDEEGGFGALTVVDGRPKAHLTYDGGASWVLRPLGVEIEAEPSAPAFLAMAGPAIAVVVGDSGPLVSRGPDVPTACYPGFARARSVAFQGAEPEGWLYVGLHRTAEEPAAVVLLAEDGSSIKVMDFRADDHAPLDIGPIAWDPTRRALMVSSRGGLLAIGPERPKRPRVKKPVTQ
jgi:hypothetical protein